MYSPNRLRPGLTVIARGALTKFSAELLPDAPCATIHPLRNGQRAMQRHLALLVSHGSGTRQLMILCNCERF